MKVLVFVKATPNSEQGVMPNDAQLQKMFADMGKFNEKLAKAGIIKDADGLKPSKFGKRLKFSDSGFSAVVDGPFAETKELVAGYWIWEVKSVDEAVSWAKLCPNPMPGEEGMLEIRPAYTLEDFEDLVGKEDYEKQKRLRKDVARQQKPKGKVKRNAGKAPAKKSAKRAKANK